MNGATCEDGIAQYSCKCDQGFEGIYCQNNTDDCVSAVCLNNATCVDQIANYTCNCSLGFTGEERRSHGVDMKSSLFNSLNPKSDRCLCLCYMNQNSRFHVAVHLFGTRLPKNSKVMRQSHTWLCLMCHFLFSPYFDVICNLLLNRCIPTLNLGTFFSKWIVN